MESKQSIQELFSSIKSSWPASLPKDSWYTLVLATLTTVKSLDSVPDLYRHLFSGSAKSPSDQRHISIRIKDVLFKQVTLIGIVCPLMALTTLASVEKEFGFPVASVDEQKSTSRYISRDESMTSVEMRKAGRVHLDRLYQRNLEGIMQTWGNHRADIEWLEERAIYGMFLSDMAFDSSSITEEDAPPLNAIEISLVTLSSIMAQNVGIGPPRWHVRGLMRLGISPKDAETVCDTIKMIAKWADIPGTEKWIRATDVASEV